MKTYALRLHPGDDLMLSLDSFVEKQRMEAACVLTCVGSLQKAVLRFANQEQSAVLEEKFEIVSLTGVVSIHGSHYHIAISDSEGRTIGAHLMEGSKIYTTAEIILAELEDLCFLRTFDPQTGYPELDIQPNQLQGKNQVT
jgi:hypothetical protein